MKFYIGLSNWYITSICLLDAMVHFSSALKWTMYGLKGSFSPDNVLIHTAMIFFPGKFLPKVFEIDLAQGG